MPAELVPTSVLRAPALVSRIVHILFIDMVRYSDLPPELKLMYMAELDELVRQTDAFTQGTRDGSMLCSPKGDGMALIFLDDMLAPLRCALELAAALTSRLHIKIRMGVHSGPVYITHNINREPDVHGDGIVMAQRVMASGDAGHIFVSSGVANLLMDVKPWSLYLHDIGCIPIKGGKAVHLYNMHGRGFGNVALPRWIVGTRVAIAYETPSIVMAGRSSVPRRSSAMWKIGGVLCLLALMGASPVVRARWRKQLALYHAPQVVSPQTTKPVKAADAGIIVSPPL